MSLPKLFAEGAQPFKSGLSVQFYKVLLADPKSASVKMNADDCKQSLIDMMYNDRKHLRIETELVHDLDQPASPEVIEEFLYV